MKRHKSIILVILGCLFLLLAAVAVKGQSLTSTHNYKHYQSWPTQSIPDTFQINNELFVFGSIYGIPQRFEVPLTDSTAYEVKNIESVSMEWGVFTHVLKCSYSSLCGCSITMIFYYQGDWPVDAYWELRDHNHNILFTGGNPTILQLDE